MNEHDQAQKNPPAEPATMPSEAVRLKMQELRAAEDRLLGAILKQHAQTDSITLIDARFIDRMGRELRANTAQKGAFNRWAPTPLQMLSEFQHHLAKLATALAAGDTEYVAEHSADIANYAMKTFQLWGQPK